MDQYSTEIDSGLVDKIVCEVKSQGLFDQFRRECLADVDTKPAYQNLQQRVESSVASFLGDQIWTPELNKNQLREKLRKNITEKGFLDIGVERIVDQVVNPKLNSNFTPKIEDVAYQYLGIVKPVNVKSELGIDTDNHQQFLPNLDLEQVSPESEKCPSVQSQSPNAHNENMMNDDRMDEEKMDDLESPAFEPIECKIVKDEIVEQDDDKMDICMGDSDDDQNKSNGFTGNNCDEVKSNLSSISGLTSNDSIEDTCENIAHKASTTIEEVQVKSECETADILKTDPITDEQKLESLPRLSPPEAVIQQFDAIEQPEEKPSIHYTNDVVENINQDSALSQVSSNSRLSIITNNNTYTRMDDVNDDGDASNGLTASVINGRNIEKESTCPYGISEEAQMQRFNESSSSSNSLVIDTDNVSNGTNQCEKRDEFVTAFDINKEEIKFEGTERKSFDIDFSETKVSTDKKQSLNGNQVESSASVKEVYKTPDTVVVSSTETSKDVNFKSEDISSVSLTDITSIKNASTKIESTSSDAKLRTEDSKGLDESSSTSSKYKESKSSSSTSSSSHRNGVETDLKSKSKDRHSSSLSSRHRGHSDRSKRSHSLSHSSSSKDKTKNSRNETDGKRRESSKHRSDERSSKNYHQSSSSSTRAGNDTSRSLSSKNHKDKERSRSDKKDSHGHSSSSQSASASRERDVSLKVDSKHSDHKKTRPEFHRSSHREKDDHASHKQKPMSRKRSRSKDSNDGSSNPSHALPNASAPTSTDQSTSATAQESATDQQNSSEQQTSSTHSSLLSANEKSLESACSTSSLNATTKDLPFTADVAENDFVLTTQPVVVDQILYGNELNLESFIDENRDNPLISSIERTLADHAKVKKPKVAANIHEARKLMKVRKQIDREEQKKLEQARVLAKQYMRSNLTTIVDDRQGVELEFACMSSGTNAPGPSISSPVKSTGGKAIIGDEKPIKSLAIPSTWTSKGEQMISDIDQTGISVDEISVEMGITEFEGFSEEVSDVAKVISRQFETVIKPILSTQTTKVKSQLIKPVNRLTHTSNSNLTPSDQLIEMMSSNEDNRQLFLENNKINESDSSAVTKTLNIRKRKYTETSISADEIPSKIAADDGELASVVANVFIAPKNESSSGRTDASTLEKQRQKTRYSNEDLFKPRPVLGGASRSRRRGINCND